MTVLLLILCLITTILCGFVDFALIKFLSELVSTGVISGSESQALKELIFLAFAAFFLKLINIVLIVLTARKISVYYVSEAIHNIIFTASPTNKADFTGVMENSNSIQTFVMANLQFISSIITAIIIIYLTLDIIETTIPLFMYFAAAIFIIFNLVVRRIQNNLGANLAQLAEDRFKPFADVVGGAFGIQISKMNLVFKSLISGIEGRLRLTQGLVFLLASTPRLFLDLLVVFVVVMFLVSESDTQSLTALAFVAIRLMPLITATFLALSKISAYWVPVMKVIEFSKNITTSNFDQANILLKENILVIGSSGSGKSTLLKNTLDKKLNEIPQILDSINQTDKIITNGIFMQRSYNFSIPLKNFKEKASFNRDMFNKFLLNKIDDSLLLNDLSGGELQRLWLSVAIKDDFTQYFLDEPTNNLDINSKKEFLSWLNGATKKIFIVSHDNDVISTCEKLNYKIINLN